MLNRILLPAVSLALLGACNTHKKTSASNTNGNTVSIQLDTISVTAANPAKREIYRASNTRLSDIIHTRLEVNFDWKLCRMNGKATILVKPYFYPTNMLYLNARGMDIKTVEVRDINMAMVKPAPDDISVTSGNIPPKPTYVYENDSLKINLSRNFAATESYYVIIEYVARPNELKAQGGSAAISDDKGLYFINPSGENPFKMRQIWTQGETQSNSVWFPTIDSPNEKMTQEILMTVEDKYTTLSNGSLVSSVKQPDGMRTDHWKLDQPHSTYLAMMAVGEFKKVTDAPWNGKEVSYYVDAQYEEHAKAIFGDTREMIDFYSSVLGVPYAWPKYSQIVARDYVSGAMENTSATLHGDFMVYQTTRETLDQKKGNSVIAHELFHQWFGDLATCESWSNLSLNESFATYGEYLWEEHKNGRDAADYHHWQSRQGYLNSSKEVDIIRFNYNDKEDMFDAFSYNKGGQVLHMLRKAVGDAAFFASLKNYLETNKYKSAEIHNLRLAFEETTGRDMNWFFNQWYLSKGRPSLKVTTNNNINNPEGKSDRPSGKIDTLIVTIEQTQDLKKYPLYTLPLEMDVYVRGRKIRRHVELTEQKQSFKFVVDAPVQLINIDGERQLLADISYTKSPYEYIFQYQTAGLLEDRMEALNQLEDKINDAQVFSFYTAAAQKDPYYAMRRLAIQKLTKAGPEHQAEVKSLLMSLYLSEKNNLVRAKILEALNKVAPAVEMSGLDMSALNDQSYAVCAEALNGLAKIDPKIAMEKAALFEREGGKDVLFSVGTIYSNYGGDGQIHFFHGALNYINGFDLMSFSGLYTKTARQCQIPENVLLAATDLEMIGRGAHKYVKFTATKGIKDILSTWESKESTAKVNLETAKKENKNTSDLEKELQTIQQTKAKISEIYNRATKA